MLRSKFLPENMIYLIESSAFSLYYSILSSMIVSVPLASLPQVLFSSITSIFFSGGTSKRKGFKCTGGVMATEAVNLFKSFYEQGNPNG